MNKLYFILLLLATILLQTTAYASPAKDQFFEQSKILDEMSDTDNAAVEKQTQRVILNSQAVLSEQGIQYEIDPEDSLVLLLFVPNSEQQFKTAHKLNQLAYSLYNKMKIQIDGRVIGKPLRIEINPLQLKKLNAGALFDEEKARLTLASSNIAEGKVDDMLAHEIRHVYNFYQFANGNDHDFAAWVRTSEKLPPMHKTYEHEFSVDEITTYSKQVLLQIKTAIREKTDFSEALDFANTGLLLIKALSRPEVLTQSQKSLESLLANASAWSTPRWVMTEYYGKNTLTLVYNNENTDSKISIYKTKIFDEVNVTHVEIKNSDYTFEVLNREDLKETQIKKLLEKSLAKISDLQKRTTIIEVGFTKTVEFLKKEDAEKALTAIRSAVEQVRIDHFSASRM